MVATPGRLFLSLSGSGSRISRSPRQGDLAPRYRFLGPELCSPCAQIRVRYQDRDDADSAYRISDFPGKIDERDRKCAKGDRYEQDEQPPPLVLKFKERACERHDHETRSHAMLLMTTQRIARFSYSPHGASDAADRP